MRFFFVSISVIVAVALCLVIVFSHLFLFEPAHDKIFKMKCAPSENSDQPEHPPSLIRVFAVRSLGS